MKIFGLKHINWLAVLLMLGTTACNNPSIMFRAKRNYPYSDLSKIENVQEYAIGVNDNLSIKVFPNKGAALLERGGASGSGSAAAGTTTAGGTGGSLIGYGSNITMTVDYDGTIKMPLLGRIKVQGLTIRECELLFEEQYKQFYVEPFSQVDITNKRIIIFPGSGGNASVLSLSNRNTNLIEVLASVGGISNNARSHRIKLIRGDLEHPLIYKIKLNRIEDLKSAGIILQGNDIIYIEPRNDLVLNFVARVSPYLGVVNFGLLLYSLIPGK